MPITTKIYLGDSVYAELQDDGSVMLTTNNGYPDDPRNVICMEPDILKSFQDWLAALARDFETG